MRDGKKQKIRRRMDSEPGQDEHERRIEIGAKAIGTLAVTYGALWATAAGIDWAVGIRPTVIELGVGILSASVTIVVAFYAAGWLIADAIPWLLVKLADLFDAVTREPADD